MNESFLTVDALNAMGKYGWELVATLPVIVFKRPAGRFLEPPEHHAAVTVRPTMITIREACRQLSISRTKLYQLIYSGQIPTVKIGRGIRIPTAGIDDWMSQHRHIV